MGGGYRCSPWYYRIWPSRSRRSRHCASAARPGGWSTRKPRTRWSKPCATPAALLLGGGSNLVIADEGWPGTAVRISTRGRRVERRPDGSVLLTVEAGEEWDDVVAATVADGLGGLECLSGIPGRTGATPVQNVGAYGVEIADALVDVDLLDRRSVVRRVPAADLGLAYRTSVLKGRSDAVVLRVRIALPGDALSAPIRYAELARALGVAPGERVPAAVAREAVLGLRRGKGMVLDPADHDTWSAGSFFTNPVLAEAPPRRADLAGGRSGQGVGGLADRARGLPPGASRAGWPGGAVEPATCWPLPIAAAARTADLLALAARSATASRPGSGCRWRRSRCWSGAPCDQLA